MTQYDIVAIFWEDHMKVSRQALVSDPDELLDSPMLSIGIIYKETEKTLMLVHDLEGQDKATYICILKKAIVAQKKYGQIELDIGGE